MCSEGRHFLAQEPTALHLSETLSARAPVGLAQSRLDLKGESLGWGLRVSVEVIGRQPVGAR